MLKLSGIFVVTKGFKKPCNLVIFENLKEGDVFEIYINLSRQTILSDNKVPDVIFTNLTNQLRPKHATSWYLAKKYLQQLKLREIKC